MMRRRLRLIVWVGVLGLLAGGIVTAGAGQRSSGGSEAGPRLLALFNMNDLEERADGTTKPTKAAESAAPAVRLLGGSVEDDGQSGVAFIDAEDEEHETGVAAAWSSGINDGPPNGLALRFEKPGGTEPVVRFDLRSTSTGSPSLELRYRTGGSGEWEPLVADRKITRDSRFHGMRFDLAEEEPGLLNARQVELIWVFAPGTGGNGTTRIDNLQVTAEKPSR